MTRQRIALQDPDHVVRTVRLLPLRSCFLRDGGVARHGRGRGRGLRAARGLVLRGAGVAAQVRRTRVSTRDGRRGDHSTW